MRVVLGLEYRGSAYCGWQSQPAGCGVQDYVELALVRFLGLPERVRIVCAGRTDTGVHASTQVVHLDTEIVRDVQSWVRGTNTYLPADIRVLWAHILPTAVAEEFHARFSAQSRSYKYLLLNRAVSPGLALGCVGWFHTPLSLALMLQATLPLHGTHDFTTFRAAECQSKTPVKTIHEIRITQSGDMFEFTFCANAFLHHMVRNIVGCLVYIGTGRQPVSWMAELIAARNRAQGAPTFAPDGLYLSQIEYDAKFGLPTYTSALSPLLGVIKGRGA